MPEFYWTDGSTLSHWNGALTTGQPAGMGGASNLIGTLISSPSGILTGHSTDLGGSSNQMSSQGYVPFGDLTSYTEWPAMTIPTTYGAGPIPILRDRDNAIGVWDDAENAFWIYIWNQNNSEYYDNSSWEHWLKVSASGTVLSEHVIETWDYTQNPTTSTGANAVVSGGYLYWSTENHLWRLDKASGVVTVLDTGSTTHKFWYRLIGALSDGRLVFSTQGGAGEGSSFDVVDVSGASWSSPLYPTNYNEIPNADLIHAADTATTTAMILNESGWATVLDDVIYYGAWDADFSGAGSIRSMDPITGSSTRLFYDATITTLYGLVVVAAGNVGQLYVNLSTDVNTPDWVSVCASVTGGWTFGTQANLHSDAAGTSDYLIDDNMATTSTFPTDNNANYHAYGDMTSTTAIGIVIDPITSGQLRFHMTIYPPSASNWALRVEAINVTAGERYVHAFTLADRYSNIGGISGPRYPVTEAELQQRLRDALLNAWPGTGPYLSTNYEVTVGLYQYPYSSGTVEVAELKILDITGSAPAVTGMMGHFNVSAVPAAPDWNQIHLGSTYANVSTTGTPEWWTCCSH